MSRAFQLGSESASDGRFQRRRSRFRDWVSEPEAGRYHLDVRGRARGRTELCRQPGIAETVGFEQIRAHSTGTPRTSVDPTGLVALQPRADLWEPPDRHHLG